MKKLAAPFSSSPARSFEDAPVSGRRFGWPLIDGYLGSQVIAGFWRGLTWFVGLFLAFVIVSGAQKVAQQKMDMSLVFLFIILQLPRIVVFTIPASLLFGTVSAFTEMSSRGEITACMAGGMSLRRMLRAPFVASVLLAIFAFWLQETVVPACELRRGQIGISALKNAGASDLFPMISKDASRVIRADGFDLKTFVMTRPNILLNRPDGSAFQISAQRALWDEAHKQWVFENGNWRNAPPLLNPKGGPAQLPQQGFFQKQTFPDVTLDPRQIGNTTRNEQDALTDHNYEMVSLKELWKYRTGLEAKVRQAQSVTEPSAQQLKDLHDLKGEVRAATFGIHDKISVPLIILSMVLVAAPLGVRPQRTASAGLALGLSLMVLLAYYIVWTLVSTWGKGGGQQPLIAAYLPFAILLGLGTFLTWKKN